MEFNPKADNNLKYEIGQRIRSASKGPVKSLARDLSYSEKQIRRYISGQTLPSTDFLMRLSKNRGVSIDYILFGNSQESNINHVNLDFNTIKKLSLDSQNTLDNIIRELFELEIKLKENTKND
ncbi:hypothetical protein P4699_20325 [Priestia aryabhattai]|uniref:helix-turn-helix domain-containing protein n=1 Tax=Priestia aryabhattai TaxID=412384 RepID=UPI002E1FF017|nr:hypothetical protein [Priestia aryabhattai]